MPLRITVGTVTDRGLNPKRATNEDRLLALPQARLFLVADGVGGRRGGQVASQTVVDVFNQAFNAQPRQGNDLLTALKQTIHLSNRSIYEAANELTELHGMATTVALVAALNDNRAIIGHVGDSRVYRFDGRDLICETEDHSEVNDAVRSGVLSAAQAAHHPRRNVINRALGAEADVEADFKIVPLNEHTSFLLCSDGVTRHLNDAELAELMRAHLHPQKFCAQVKEICFERGAEDNLTAVVVDFGDRRYADEQTRPAIARLRAASKGAASSGGSRFQVEFGDPSGPLSSPVIDRSGSRPAAGNATETEAVTDSARLRQAASREKETRDLAARPTEDGLHAGANERQTTANAKSWIQPAAERPRNHAPQPSAPPPSVPNSSGDNKGRDMLLLGFYLVLLMLAFGVGRYYNELLAWVTGEPAAALNRTTINPGRSDPELAAARALFEERRYDKARERLAQLAAAKPENAELRYWLGRADYEMKQYPDAVKHLNEAARLDATLPDLYVHLALAYSALNDKKNMEESLKKALQ
ncbi:MAG: protein phosphatase 2C domain-containing protein [Acidobacteria bacterium]|nr:protein phosphatase 2C domain-containing protein [Acidobacteriota bacterium]